ncbi:MAG: hypothetical protein AB1556_17745 [Bacillota bacterium]
MACKEGALTGIFKALLYLLLLELLCRLLSEVSRRANRWSGIEPGRLNFA